MPYPKNFLFGSATSSHQIEGDNINSDWYAWEKIPGHINDGSTSLEGDSWEKFAENIDLLKNSNQNAYRLSIEWAKIEPEKGKFDQKAIEHYRKQFQLLKQSNITIMVTLFHFVLPQWVADLDGFNNPRNIPYFTTYCQKMIDEYKDLVDLWTTINEPTVYALKGYLQGEWCPGISNQYQFFNVWKNLALAHNRTYDKIKQYHPYISLGIVLNQAVYEPAEQSYLAKSLTWIVRYFSNDLFTKRIINHTDFLGINYYMRFFIGPYHPMVKSDATPKSDFGWPLHPESIYDLIIQNTKWQKPIYITENGLADEKDKNRADFIIKTLKAIEKAIDEGAPIKGYFHWSLLDNFEWAEGYKMKFGLHTKDRQPRPSAKVYAELIKKYLE